jgi:biopolymer transport protein ExbD/biopolymer transport protein TolR
MGVNGEINVVSLIDVMMLLMVVFMITAPMMQGGVDIELPKADVRPLDAKNGLVVSMNSAGVIKVDDVTMTFAEFSGSIKALSDKKGGGGIYLRADRTLDVESVLRVLAAISAAGITPVGIVGEPETVR